MLKIKTIPKIRNLISSRNRYKVARGGRGSGKSYGIGTVMLLRGLAEPGIRVLCTRETQNSLADSTLAIMKRIIAEYQLASYFEVTKYGLATIYGTEFIFRGLQQPDRIKSLDNIKYCWVAEGQRITEDAWEILTPTVRADDSEIWIDYNPDSKEDPVVTRFAEREDVAHEHINWQDNPYFPDVLRREMEYDRAHDMDRYLWIWEGQFRRVSDALVFKGKYTVETFTTPSDAAFYLGADWGFSSDPSALVRCYIVDRDLFIDQEAYEIGCEIDYLPNLFDNVPKARRWKIIADSSRPDTISYMRRQGFNITGSRKGKGSVEDGIEFLRSFERIVIHPRCRNVIAEFGTYSYIRDRLTGDPTPRLEDRNNHCIDSLRYALEQVRHKSGTVNLSGRF